MSDHRHDDLELSRLLRNLPREKASDGFAPRVVAAARRPQPLARGPVLGLAAAAALALVIGLALRPISRTATPVSDPTSPRMEAIAREYARLEAEWTALKRLRDGARPVVYLGATEQADLVLDLEQLARLRAGSRGGQGPRSSGFQPVAFTNGEHQP